MAKKCTKCQKNKKQKGKDICFACNFGLCCRICERLSHDVENHACARCRKEKIRKEEQQERLKWFLESRGNEYEIYGNWTCWNCHSRRKEVLKAGTSFFETDNTIKCNWCIHTSLPPLELGGQGDWWGLKFAAQTCRE